MIRRANEDPSGNSRPNTVIFATAGNVWVLAVPHVFNGVETCKVGLGATATIHAFGGGLGHVAGWSKPNTVHRRWVSKAVEMSAVKAAWRSILRLQGLLETLDNPKKYNHEITMEELKSIIQEWSLDEKFLQKISGIPPFIIGNLLQNDIKDKGVTKTSAAQIDKMSQISDTRKLINGLLAHFMSSHSIDSTQTANSSNEVSLIRLHILLVSEASLSLLLEFREQVRGNNYDPEGVKLAKLQSIDELISLVEEGQELQVSNDPAKAEVVESWGSRFKAALFEDFVGTFTPENIAGATIPTSIILTCSTLGSLIAGPVGLGAGGVLGHLLTRQIKPGQAADRLQKAFAEIDIESNKTSK